MEEKHVGDTEAKRPFLIKLENFWYHYKWHTIVALFLVITITILSVQTCRTVTYDVHILYAGHYEIDRVGVGGDTPQHTKLVSEFKKVTGDYDNDGNVNVDLRNLFVLNQAEKDAALEGTVGMEINEALVDEDTRTLSTVILHGEYFVCFLSERLFLEYEEQYEGELFSSLEPYTDKSKEYRYASELKTGIYLDSIEGFSALPEMSNMPSDTVLCLRALSEVSTLFNKQKNEEYFASAEKVVTNILHYE